MTTWSIQYGDETGSQVNRTTDDIGEVHATLEVIVKDSERKAGYAGQTATWHGFDPRTDDGYGVGCWTLDIVNLDTHTPDGYTIEEAAEMQAEFYGADLVEVEGPECAACGDDRAMCTESDAHHTVTEFGQEAPSTLGTVSERVGILSSLLETYEGPGNRIAIGAYVSESEAILTVERTLVPAVVNTWKITLKRGTADVAIKFTDGSTEWFGPMEALVFMHRVLTD